MQMDFQNELFAKQAVTTAAVKSDAYDLTSAGHDPSIGDQISGLIAVTTAAGGAVVATSYKLDVIQAADSSFTTPDVLASVTYAGSTFTKDKKYEIPVPQGVITKRYIGLQITPTGGTTPTLSVSGYIVPSREIPVNTNFTKVQITI